MAKKQWRITHRDLEILAFLARYAAATAEQVRREFFDGSIKAAYRRLKALQDRGLVVGERVFYRMPAVYRVTEQGARLAEADLSAPGNDLSRLLHTLELVEVSHRLREHEEGATRWVTEREIMRDKLVARREKETGRMSPGGKMGRRLDGILVFESGEELGVELELSPKRAASYRRIFADLERQIGAGEMDAVRFLFPSARAMERVQHLSERHELLKGRIEFARWAPVFEHRR